MAFHIPCLPAAERDLFINQSRLEYAMSKAKQQRIPIPAPPKTTSQLSAP